MKTKTFGELKSKAKDKFSFILIGCPDWPPLLKGLTTPRVFNDMIDLINAILEQTKGDEAKQWLRLCLLEVRKSEQSYGEGKPSEGRKLIQQAEDYFDNAFSKKPIEAKFVAGKSGPALDTEKGFPS